MTKVSKCIVFPLVFIFIIACGSEQLPNTLVEVLPETTGPDTALTILEIPTHVLTLNISDSDIKEKIEETYGMRAELWRVREGYAVLGFDVETTNTTKLQASQYNSELEPNQDVFLSGGQTAWMNGSVSAWAGGSVSAWAGGSVSAWAGGMVSAWAGGEYVPLPENSEKWQKLRLEEAHGLASNLGKGVTVAVIDSGIDLEHSAFKGGLVHSKDWWDFVDNDALPQERGQLGKGAYGHGTNVASIILQIAPRTKIMPLRVLKPNGNGDTLTIAAAIHFAIDNGADIINLSLGSKEISEPVKRAIKAATDKHIFVISSSGNDGKQTITFPANQAKVDSQVGEFSVAVGSVDANDEKSSFSNYGSALEIVSSGEMVYGPVPGNRLGAWSGTSMAAPMVSGTLALALAETLTEDIDRLTDRLEDRAVNIYNQGKNEAYDDLLGEGRLDIAEFLNKVMF